MNNVSGGMKSLCEDITNAYGDRIEDIKLLRKDADAIRENARKFVNHCKKLHKEMAKDLRMNLAENREELIKDVSSLRKDFRKKEKEIRSDLGEAREIWNKMQETLKTKSNKKR